MFGAWLHQQERWHTITRDSISRRRFEPMELEVADSRMTTAVWNLLARINTKTLMGFAAFYAGTSHWTADNIRGAIYSAFLHKFARFLVMKCCFGKDHSVRGPFVTLYLTVSAQTQVPKSRAFWAVGSGELADINELDIRNEELPWISNDLS